LRNKDKKFSDYKTAAIHVRAKSTTHFVMAKFVSIVTNKSEI